MNKELLNKDWREEVKNRFVLSCNIMSSGIGRIEESELHWISNYWLSEIESILKSKQEEIEKAIDELPTMYTVTSISGERIPLLIKDDLKPIISNILK